MLEWPSEMTRNWWTYVHSSWAMPWTVSEKVFLAKYLRSPAQQCLTFSPQKFPPGPLFSASLSISMSHPHPPSRPVPCTNNFGSGMSKDTFEKQLLCCTGLLQTLRLQGALEEWDLDLEEGSKLAWLTLGVTAFYTLSEFYKSMKWTHTQIFGSFIQI